jgi:hypothetical protein
VESTTAAPSFRRSWIAGKGSTWPFQMSTAQIPQRPHQAGGLRQVRVPRARC